jgi:L-seryl-tRNA(Ser) seleniumtransferase
MFVNQDYDSVLRMYDERAKVITDAVKKFGVTACPRQFNPQALGNVTPYYSWQIDRSRINLSGTEVMKQLADTRPLGIGSMGASAGGMRGRETDAPSVRPVSDTRGGQHGVPKDPDTFGFAVWQIKQGEDKIIAERLVEIFGAAVKA